MLPVKKTSPLPPPQSHTHKPFKCCLRVLCMTFKLQYKRNIVNGMGWFRHARIIMTQDPITK